MSAEDALALLEAPTNDGANRDAMFVQSLPAQHVTGLGYRARPDQLYFSPVSPVEPELDFRPDSDFTNEAALRFGLELRDLLAGAAAEELDLGTDE
jgi:hypothetical protein